MGLLDLFSSKTEKERQESVDKKVADFEKRIASLEADIKALTERFDALNKAILSKREDSVVIQTAEPVKDESKQTTVEQPETQKEENKNSSKRGRKPKNTKDTAFNSENREDSKVKTELDELKPNKKGASKRRGRPKKIKEEAKPATNNEDLSLETETSDKVEKPKPKQSKKPKSSVKKSNTKRGRKPKEENKSTLGKKRGKPKKTAEPIPDAAVMGLDFDEPVEEKLVEKKSDKRAKPIKVDKNRKIESFADIVELTNKDE